jgi:hypothetical protein
METATLVRQFRPSYFSGDGFGEAWGIHWYAYQQ